jgi:hypothetical protein
VRRFLLQGACVAVGALLCASAAGATTDPPRTVFVQAGIAEGTHAVVFGLTRGWSGERPLWGGQLTGYWEVSLGRWTSDAGPGHAASSWVTQVGVTPVWRWQAAASPWFVEAGVGANLVVPVYRARDRRFSTAFNFGDHLAVGRQFGATSEWEVAVRLQHFSNAGIEKPNPGADFLQLRLARRW